MATVAQLEAYLLEELPNLPTFQADAEAVVSAVGGKAKVQAGQVLVDLGFAMAAQYPFESPPVSHADAVAQCKALPKPPGGWLAAIQAVLALLASLGILTPAA